MSSESNEDLIQMIDDDLDGQHSISGPEKDALVAAFCRVKPPQIPEDGEYTMEYITLNDDGRKGGVSIKPGNITLHWKKLIDAVPEIVMTGAGAAASPWLIVLGALIIWKKLYSTSRIDLEPQHATAMLTMWKNHDGNQWIDEEDARNLTNKALVEFDLNQVSEKTFAGIVDDLSKSGCIKIKDGRIWLCEWIRRRR